MYRILFCFIFAWLYSLSIGYGQVKHPILIVNDSAERNFPNEFGQPPKFPGGQQAFDDFIRKTIRYPRVKKRIQGRVIIIFIVRKDGRVSGARISKSLAPKYDAEALRAINLSPRWIPGDNGDKPCDYEMSLPINFTKDDK